MTPRPPQRDGCAPGCTAYGLSTWGTGAFLALFALAIILQFRASGFSYAHDDAFISYRYAAHLASGDGLVFNVGERVWGYTSPLQTLLLALAGRLGFDIPSASVCLAIVWISLASALVFQLARPLLPCAFCALLALYLATYAVGYEFLGLESNLLLALQCLFLLLLSRRRYAAASLAASFSCLARPDSLLMVVPILLLVRGARSPRNLALFAAPGIAWLLFAWAYYGDVLPNSLDAKLALTAFSEYLASAFGRLTEFPVARDFPLVGAWRPRGGSHWFTSASLVLLGLCTLLDERFRRRPALVYALLLYPWVALLAYSLIGSPPAHTWELYSAYFFFRCGVVLGFFSLLCALWERFARDSGRTRTALAALAVPLLVFPVALIAFNAKRCFDYPEFNRDFFWGGVRHETYVDIADWINRNLPAGETLVLAEVGTIGYLTDLHIIDASGIVTKGLDPDERMRPPRVARRFRPGYLLITGDKPALRISRSLRYERVQYFPKRRFSDFSLLARR